MHKDGGSVEETKKADAPVPPAPVEEKKAPEQEKEVAAKANEAPQEKPAAPEQPASPPTPETPAAPTAPAKPEAPGTTAAPDMTKVLEGITQTLAKQGESIAKIMEKLSMADEIKETKPEGEITEAPKEEPKKEEAPKEETPKEEAKEAPTEEAKEPAKEEAPEKKKEDMGKAAVTDMKKSVEQAGKTPRPPVKELAFDPTKHGQTGNGKIPTLKEIMDGAKLDTLDFVKNGFGAL